jgi:hypothetical protein
MPPTWFSFFEKVLQMHADSGIVSARTDWLYHALFS